jgi:hypothetical protein
MLGREGTDQMPEDSRPTAACGLAQAYADVRATTSNWLRH